MRDDAVVRRPRVQMLSLTATGTPANGPGTSPAARLASTWAARARARSWHTVLKAFSAGFTRSIRASAWRQTSTADTRPAATSSRMLRAVVIDASPADDARHAEQACVLRGVGRVRGGFLRRQRGAQLVAPLGIHTREHVGRGGHAGGVHGL